MGKLSSKARARQGKAKAELLSKAGQSKGGITKQGGAKAKQGCQVKRKDAEQSGDGTAGTAEGIVGIAAPPSVLKKRENAKKQSALIDGRRKEYRPAVIVNTLL
jgi:hypothetical protein